MVRPSIFAAVVTASALLAMGSSAAFASAPAPLPITGVTGSEAPSGGAPTEPVAPTTPAAEAPSGGAAVDPDPALPVVEQTPATTPTEPTNASTEGSATTAPGGEGATLAEPEGQGAAVESPAEVSEIVRPDVIEAEAPADVRSAASVTASQPGAPINLTHGVARPAATGGEPSVIVERLLPRVERQLRGVQTQMDDLHRRLAEGGAPPSNSLVRLRRSLELIAPALAALGARVDAGGPLSPDLRQLLHRVNKRLDGAHVSAGALAAALRRSGVRGPEVTALLRELEGFGTSGAMFSPVSSITASQSLYATDGTHSYAQPAAAAATAEPAHHAAPPQPKVAVHEAVATHHSPAPDEIVRQVAASGSASAGPGGAFSAAGIAGLAALLGFLVLPRLLTRVQLMTARSYKAAFLVPLQRPG